LTNLRSIYIGINNKDAMLTYQVLMKKVFGDKYADYEVFLEFPEDIDAASKAIASDRCDVLTLASLDYFRMRQTTELEPLAIMSKGDRAAEPYLFLTPAGTDLDDIIAKTDRTLVVEQSGGGDVATEWLSSVLMERGLPPINTFFANVHHAKPSRVVLPLFFGQANACVVSESTFTVMAELNPQVKRKINIEKRSPGFVNLLICGTKNMNPDDRLRVVEELATLNDHPEGQQALTIIQMKRFFRYEPDYLNATKALYDRHSKLLGRVNQ
jgi:ABC-type phosphate/phosphonate transport system substrate-binding protein